MRQTFWLGSADWRLVRRHLSILFVITTLFQIAIVGSALTEARRAWLHERLIRAETAARVLLAFRSLPVAADLKTEAAFSARLDLIQLAAVTEVRLRQPVQSEVVIGNTQTEVTSKRILLSGEGALAAAVAALQCLFGGNAGSLTIQELLSPTGTIEITVRSGDLSRHLRSVAVWASTSAGLLVVVGWIGFCAFRARLLWPLRQLTSDIYALRRLGEVHQSSGIRLRSNLKQAARDMVGLRRDARDRAWRVARLAALSAMLGKFSHDLRGILTPALLAAERLEGHSDSNVRRAAETITRSVERATALVRSGLAFARTNAVTPHLESFQLRDVVTEAASYARATVPQIYIKNLVDSTVQVVADRNHVVRALTELFQNALEIGAQTVGVAASLAGSAVTLTVRDDGPGLPASLVAGLFKPPETVGQLDTAAFRLATARDLLTACSGDLRLVTTTSTGTEFQLMLPASSGPPAGK